MSTKGRLERLEKQAADKNAAVCATVIIWLSYGGGIAGVLSADDRDAIASQGYVVKDSGLTAHGSRTIQVFHNNTPAAKLAAKAEVEAFPAAD